MHLINRAGLAVLTATLALTAACSDNIAPPPPPPPAVFDGPTARAKVEPLAAVLDQPIVRSSTGALSYYAVLASEASTDGTASSAPAVSMPLGFSRALTPLAPLASLNIVTIPAQFAGKTFVFDPASNFYVLDPTVTGAPAAGVRLVLYTFDETGYPDEPLTRVGYLDVTPAANGADGVHLVVVRDTPQQTVADFERTRTAITGGSSFNLSGWMTDGTTRMDVALDGSVTGVAPQRILTYDSKLSSASLGVGAELTLRYDGVAGTESGGFVVKYDGHTFTSASTPPADGEMRFDGQLYARIVFPTTADGSSQYLKPDGTSLTDAEIADVQGLLARAGAANFFWIGLASP